MTWELGVLLLMSLGAVCIAFILAHHQRMLKRASDTGRWKYEEIHGHPPPEKGERD